MARVQLITLHADKGEECLLVLSTYLPTPEAEALNIHTASLLAAAPSDT